MPKHKIGGYFIIVLVALNLLLWLLFPPQDDGLVKKGRSYRVEAVHRLGCLARLQR